MTYFFERSIMKLKNREGDMEMLLSTKEVANYMKISPTQVRRLVHKQVLPCIRVSPRVLRFRKEEVDKFLEGREY